ncbi:MAG: FG-GAP repeat domain-containing protein, partial [Candidatus Krumholzibacteriia bacterium]
IATAADPDRLGVYDIVGGAEPLSLRALVALPEDPGGLVAGLAAPDGSVRLVVTLPGVDSWLIVGEQDGAWQVLQQVDTGDRPVDAAVIDLEGDGRPEVVTADNGVLSRGLSIHRADADGRYALAAQVATPGAPSALFAFDAQGDARPELFVAYADSARVTCYAAEGGTLVPVADLPAPLPASGLHVARFAGDELGLWAWSSTRGVANYFRNTGAGWVFTDTYFAGGRAVQGRLDDLNGDSYPDLVIANGESASLGLLFGNNTRSFRAYLATPLPEQPVDGRLYDENGDGRPDFAVTCQGSRSLEILHGDGRGHLRRDLPPVPLGDVPAGLTVLRADADLLPDVAVTLPAVNQAVVLRRLPEGGYLETARFATGAFPFRVVAGDLDLDGADDLVIANLLAETFTVAWGAGDGTFPVRSTLTPMTAIADLALVDLNGDHRPEIVAVSGQEALFTLLNLGGRVFGPPMIYLLQDQPATLATGDLDGDGDADVVVGQRTGAAVSIYENRGNGFLTLRSSDLALGGWPGALAVNDVNLDGLRDIVVALPGRQEIALLVNRGGWVWSPPLRWVSALAPTALGVGDLNGDAIPDIVQLDLTLGLAVTMLNVEPNPVPVAPVPLAVTCADGVLEIRACPPPAAGWTIEAVDGAGTRELAADGVARCGELARLGDGWLLRLTPADRAVAGLASGAPATVRLRGRAPDTVAATVAAPAACLAADGVVAGSDLVLLGAAPNPFNPRVEVRFRLPRAGPVRGTIHDAAGRLVADLGRRWYAAGEHTLRWDGRSADGPAGAGLYLLTLSAEGRAVSRKLTLLK